MYFLELAAQAVRGFSPSIRVALKPGYIALQSPTELPAPLAGLILALAFPDGRGGDAAFLAPGAKAGRAGLSLQGNDGSVWRIVRDLGGAGALNKLNKATNQFDVISQDALEMGQSLRAGAGFPARTTWEQLFTLTGPQLPTRRPKGPAKAPGAAPAKAAAAPPRMAANAWNMDVGTPAPDADPARLAALESELVTAKRAGEVQFRLDGVTGELYELESKSKGWDELRGQLAQARADAARVADAAGNLPDDIIARAKRYPDDRKRYEDQLARLQEEQQSIIDNTPPPPEPLQKDQRFLGSLVLGLALLIGAMFLEGSLRYVALLSLVPFSFAALLALRFIEDLQAGGRDGGKSEVLTAREKKLTDDFQLTTTLVQGAFKSVGAETLDDFMAEMARRAGLKQKVAELELQVAELEVEPEYQAVAGRIARLKAEQESCNQELLGMSGGYVRDVREIEREIARFNEPAAPPPPRPSASGEGFAPVATSPAETWDDPIPPLMLLATDLFTTDIPSLWSVLHARAAQYLTALTDRRYHGISLDKDGHATLEAPGREVSARELPGKDLDLMFIALRLSLIEKAVGQHKLPVVIEDTFSTVLDAAKQPLFGRMVKHLGSLTQVLHVSGAGQTASLADTPTSI